MSDSANNRTDIDGNVEGSAFTGGFQGPVQSTYVDNRGLRPEPTTTDTKIDAMWQIVGDLDKRLWYDGNERKKRQEETDKHRETMLAQIRDIGVRVARVEFAFVGLVVGLALAGMLVLLVAMR